MPLLSVSVPLQPHQMHTVPQSQRSSTLDPEIPAREVPAREVQGAAQRHTSSFWKKRGKREEDKQQGGPGRYRQIISYAQPEVLDHWLWQLPPLLPP